MRYYIISILLFTSIIQGQSQNCNAFIYQGDTLQHDACVIAEEANNYYQFSKEYQEIYDKAIAKCPYFATAYHAKSVAYLKSGDFINWKILIDKAVSLKPKEYLSNRGWCRYQFFRDYQGAINDIEQLDSLVEYDIGYSSGGDYHLNIAKAICYNALGNNPRAIEIIEEQLKAKGYSTGNYDYLHLGILYLESKQYQKALENFNLQDEIYNIAENQYYKAKAYHALGDAKKYAKHLKLSFELHRKGGKMFDSYNHHMGTIYLNHIANELALLND